MLNLLLGLRDERLHGVMIKIKALGKQPLDRGSLRLIETAVHMRCLNQ